MNNKLKGCPNTPNTIKRGQTENRQKKQLRKWQTQQEKRNKMRQTVITQDGNEQPS